MNIYTPQQNGVNKLFENDQYITFHRYGTLWVEESKPWTYRGHFQDWSSNLISKPKIR